MLTLLPVFVLVIAPEYLLHGPLTRHSALNSGLDYRGGGGENTNMCAFVYAFNANVNSRK